MQNFCLQSAEAALLALSTSKGGLTESEAQKRLSIYGKNTVQTAKKNGILRLFFSQFKDVLTLLLIAAAIISAIIAVFSGDKNDLVDTFIIIFIIFLNATVGCVQQFRADKAIENLKKLSVTKVKVRRGGKDLLLNSEDITVGDIIMLEEGDIVPADCRIVSCSNLKVDESALTGESVGVEKTEHKLLGGKIALSERKNNLFSSTFVLGGSGEAVVYAVGMDTETGKIAKLMQGGRPQKTPLEKSLDKLGKIITAFVLAVTAVIFICGLIGKSGGLLHNFMTAVAVAVAAIPEGMPAVVTVIMAMGVTKMSKKNIVIRKLKAVETLGGCNYICSDKTGTLTQNKMRVVGAYCPDSGQNSSSFAHKKMLQCILACNSVKGKRGAYMGDPTEVALINYADDAGVNYSFDRILENPFDSTRKLMSVKVACDGADEWFVKGAPDVIIKKCNRIATAQGVRQITSVDVNEVFKQNEYMAQNGLRVLGFAYKQADCLDAEEGLVFLGLCAMADGVKPGVKEAVAQCKTAGVTTVMITGDSKITAFAIAKKLNITQSEEEVISGEELDLLPPKQKKNAVLQCKVFARVTPKHKNYIVKTLKSADNVVAMTGDGINDAPALKSADIGIAMGKSGTEVTKSAADMVIADDNFTTIVAAVAEGRRIFSNIKKTINFFLATNLAEVLAILFAAIFFAGKNFLLSTQLLWINLITDSLPVLALGTERGESNIMNRPPERAERALFSKSALIPVLIFGVFISAVTVGVFNFACALWGNEAATTITFLVISFMELFHAFNVRDESSSIISKNFFSNKILLLTVGIGVVVNLLLLIIPPVSNAFGLVTLSGEQWLTVALASVSIIVFGEIFKFCKKIYKKIKARAKKPNVEKSRKILQT